MLGVNDVKIGGKEVYMKRGLVDKGGGRMGGVGEELTVHDLL